MTMPDEAARPCRKWRARLRGLPRPLVALAWAGRPAQANDANRSMRFEHLAPLADIPASFLAIQKGPAQMQPFTAPAGPPVLSLAAEIDDFEDTAAILSIADLLISIDSAPAHLAGALGRPVWVLLSAIHCWRWLQTGEASPWYPSMRLFRQASRGDWPGLVGNVAHQLRAWAAGQETALEQSPE